MPTEDPAFLANQRARFHEDKRAGIIVSNIVLLVVAYLAVLLKFIARRLAHTEVRIDDYWNWGSLVCLQPSGDRANIDCYQVVFTVYICGNFALVHYGLGLHIIRVTSLKGFVIVSKLSLRGSVEVCN